MISQLGATLRPDAANCAAKNITIKPKAIINKPAAHFSPKYGWVNRLPRLIQSEAKKGDNTIMKIELIDWNQAVGISKLATSRFVKSLVKRLSDDPACSKPAQNKIEAIQIIRIAPKALCSFELKFPQINNPKKYIKNNEAITSVICWAMTTGFKTI